MICGLYYYLCLCIIGPAAVGAECAGFDGDSGSGGDSGEDVEAGGSIGVDQMPELGGVGFAGGFGLVKPEIY